MSSDNGIITKELAYKKLRENGYKLIERKYKDTVIMSREEREIREKYNKVMKKWIVFNRASTNVFALFVLTFTLGRDMIEMSILWERTNSRFYLWW